MSPKIRLQLSIMMFLQFFIWGAWFVTMYPFLLKLGFDDVQIGSAYSTTAIAAIVSPFFVGMIADRFFNAERVMGVLHILGGVLLYVVSGITEPGLFFWVLLLHTFCYMPTLALVNSISFHQMTDPGKEFPGIRVLGTIGWIAAGLVVGFMPESITGLGSIESTDLPMKIGAAVSVAMGIYCFFLPATPPKGKGQKVTVSEVLGLEALQLMKNRNFAVFVISSFLICIPLAFYYQSANGFITALGVANPAGKMTMGQMSEIFFMLVMPFFFIRLGVKKMLLVGMLFWVGRYFLFAFGNGGSLVFMIYLGILFHGICYDFFFVTGQIYIDRRAPRQLRSSAQGFITLVTLGLGMLIGNMINGWVGKAFTTTEVIDGVDTVVKNWQGVWLVPAIMALVVAVGFALLFVDEPEVSLEEPA